MGGEGGKEPRPNTLNKVKSKYVFLVRPCKPFRSTAQKNDMPFVLTLSPPVLVPDTGAILEVPGENCKGSTGEVGHP